MLGTVYTKLLDLSLQGTLVILAVLLLRFFLRKLPKIFSYCLWSVVLFRLLCPFSIEAPVSVVPRVAPVSESYTLQEQDISFASAGVAAYHAMGDALNGGLGVQHIYTEEINDQGYQRIVTASWWEVWVLFGQYVWLLGVAAFCIYSLISYIRLRRRLVGAMRLESNIYLADHIPTPFVLGLFSPKIYLPSSLQGSERVHILAHEQYHIRRGDPIAKLLAFAALSLHWFNPFVWLAYFLFCKDMEMSCDEAVLKRLGEEIRADYAESLLKLSAGKKGIGIMPLAFGEGDTKGRICNLAQWKKHKLWVISLAGVLIAVVIALLALSPPHTLDDRLSVFVDCQIAEHNQSKDSKGRASCVNWELLGKERKGRNTVLYMWVLYEEYSMEDGALKVETGSHIPVVITASENEGQYSLVEYWIPRDGSYYPTDIKSKFPWYLHSKALDSQRYIKKQKQENEKMAREYFREENKTKPVPGGVAVSEAFSAVLSYAGYTGVGALYSDSLNALTFAQSAVQHLPVFKLTSEAELETFINKYSSELTLDQAYEEVPSFAGVAKRYDASFFEKNGLLLVYIPSGNSSDRYKLSSVENGSTLCLHIRKQQGSLNNTDQMVGWFITVTVPHSLLAGAMKYDADLDNAQTLQGGSAPLVTTVEDGEQSKLRYVQSVLPASDFTRLSQKVRGAVDAEWKRYDSMTRWEHALSSHLFGCVYLSADTWEQWQQDTGITLQNPLSEVRWLSPTDYFGGISNDPDTPHIKTTVYATQQTDRNISQIHLEAGYKTENTRVVLRAVVWNEGGVYTTAMVERGAELYSEERLTGSGIPVLLTYSDEETSYSDLKAWWVQNSALFTVRVIGDQDASKEVWNTMDKLLTEL